ncbi:MAG: radical SAM protein [Elusimicrobia bacterium]|nr:radical SAM protein [Elusimicrobiota bacterium]
MIDLQLLFPPLGWRFTFPELGMPQLTAYLRGRGFSVRQKDLNAVVCGALPEAPEPGLLGVGLRRDPRLWNHGTPAYPLDEVLKAARRPHPLYEKLYRGHVRASVRGARTVGFSVVTAGQVLPSLYLARRIRSEMPKARLCLGGPWASASWEGLEDWPGIFEHLDYVVGFEGERPLESLLASGETGFDPARVPGLAFLRNGRVVRTAEGPGVALEKLPAPVFDGFDLGRYPTRWLPYQTTRGCEWGSCAFCYHVFSGRGSESKSPAKMVREMTALAKGTGIRTFHLADLSTPPGVLASLGRTFSRSGQPLRWRALVRAGPAFTPGFCRMLKAGGCDTLYFGLETSDARGLRRLNKGISLKTLGADIRACSGAGIGVGVFILNYPGQSLAEFRKTLTFTLARAPALAHAEVQRFEMGRWMSGRPGLKGSLAPGWSKDLNSFNVPYRAPGIPMAVFKAEKEAFARSFHAACRHQDPAADNDREWDRKEGGRPRLLLVEIDIDSAYRAVYFPFFQGLARREAVECKWVRFAALGKLPLDSDGVPLPPEDAARLAAHVGEFRPTHAVFNFRPSASLLRALGRGAPACAYLGPRDDRCAEPPCPGPAPVPILPSETDLAAFLGLARAEPATPDYGWVAGNEGALAIESNPYVVLGSVCGYRKPFAANPFFRGVDLSGCSMTGGCSFCRKSEYFQDISEGIVPVLERQLSALEKTCPRPGGRRLQVWLLGDRIVPCIDAVAEAVVRLRLSPADFKFETRVDLLLKNARRFEAALRRLEGTGHRFSLGEFGVENFASPELERYNKGVTPCQNLAALRLIAGWESRFPGVFVMAGKRGGMSMITFNPWTRPEELDTNIAVAEAAGLGKIPGLTSRLRLFGGSPLEAKARQERLTARSFGDPLLDTGRMSFFAPEVPWRFAAPELEAVLRVLIRLAEDPVGADPLSRDVSAFVRESGLRGLSIYRLAHLVVLASQDAAWRGRRVRPPQLLAAAGRLAAEHPVASGDGWDAGFWSTVEGRVAVPGAVRPDADLRVPRSEYPVALLWGPGDCWVELVPRSRPGDRFRYGAGRSSGSGPDLEALRSGDELVLGKETFLVLRRGRPLASLSGRAFLWWRRKAFQTDFWRALAASRQRPGPA